MCTVWYYYFVPEVFLHSRGIGAAPVTMDYIFGGDLMSEQQKQLPPSGLTTKMLRGRSRPPLSINPLYTEKKHDLQRPSAKKKEGVILIGSDNLLQ